MKAPSAAVTAAISNNKPLGPSQDKLDQLRAKAAEARDLEQEINDLQERLKEKQKLLQEIFFKTLPDLMDEAKTDRVGLPAEGNAPPFDAILQPYYAANIAASWPEERRAKAFDYLITSGNGDLIKTEVSVALPRGDLQAAQRLLEDINKKLAKKGIQGQLKQTVSHQTLTAWLREQIEQYQRTPPLDVIGGTVGRVVRLKQR